MFNQNNRYSSYNEDTPEDYNYVPQRPISITIVCVVIVLIMIIGLVNLMDLTSDPALSIPLWYWGLVIGQFALVVGAIIGLWNMRKWGAYIYTVNFVINLGLLLFNFNPFVLVIPMVLMFFIYRKFGEMR
jgi:hypothetical protein